MDDSDAESEELGGKRKFFTGGHEMLGLYGEGIAKMPENPGLLSKVLGFSEQEVTDSLPAVMPFFTVANGFILCPELEDYRKHLEAIKAKQSRGGKVGSALTNNKRYPLKNRIETDVTSTPSSDSSSTLKVPRRGQVES